MSKRNQRTTSAPAVEETVMAPEPVDEIVEKVIGVVSGCRRLNIRKAPNLDADILCWAPVNSELTIDTSDSTDEWLHVCTTAGVEGYCMSEYVFIQKRG